MPPDQEFVLQKGQKGNLQQCLFVVLENDEHGTVTKDDWRHIVNKHPSLLRLTLESSFMKNFSCFAAWIEYNKGCF